MSPMKRQIWTIILIFAVTASSGLAQVKKGNDTNREIQKNIAADNQFLKVFETGNVSLLDAIIAPQFYNHTGNNKGVDSLKSAIKRFHKMMKTVKLDLIRQFADNEYVSDWIRYTSADAKIVIEGIEMTRYVKGKAVEHWFFPYDQRH
jgi:predicted SnoaL-like aldol condensation-catalyzing enzyme